ncbi:hypothetical protein [Methylomonas albis]|uniref:Condensation domain-containing protein n=1 Tax=Methylomonas albis TaxID=1854563 RepID=A0ABR9CYA6_9GAMM|nr:hypothetical protein [Methylomonas albis]MBD9355847.1 hypothetical protein [Methylomonas albis]CAD6878872.1 hypothetical protein [Methylomonas albis]
MTDLAEKLFNPGDYFTFVLDQEIRNAGMPGGYCGFALQLADTPDLPALQKRLDLLVECFPQASAIIQPRGKRFAWVATGNPIALELHQCRPGADESEQSQQLLLDIFNRPESRPLTVHWIAGAEGGTLLLIWLHPLLDARGCKILLDFLSSDKPDSFKDSPSLIEAKLAQWSFWKKLQLFFKAKRHNTAANSLNSCLPTQVEQGPQRLQLKVQRFDAEQSQGIAKLAQQSTGLTGRTLYYLGCFMRAMELVGPPAAKDGYCIPYAFNLRRQNAPTPVFGNHIGCLFARATREQVRDRTGLFAHLLSEHQQVVRDELDLAYLPLMWLGQWLSPEKYAKVLRKQHSGGELSSLWFSDIGDLSWSKKGFLGVPVSNLSLMCWMTLPPGLALLASQLDGKLVLSYSYLAPAIDEAWLDAVIARMNVELLNSP